MVTRNLLLLALFVAFQASTASPHPGGTNADGCHTNRKTGEYHCHGAKSPPTGRVDYCHLVNGERRCGYSRETCEELVERFGGYCRRE